MCAALLWALCHFTEDVFVVGTDDVFVVGTVPLHRARSTGLR